MEGGGLLELEGAELLVDHLPYYLVGCHCEWWWSCGRKLAMVELVVVVGREFLSGNLVALAWLLDGLRTGTTTPQWGWCVDSPFSTRHYNRRLTKLERAQCSYGGKTGAALVRNLWLLEPLISRSIVSLVNVTILTNRQLAKRSAAL
jgi:hypothetical protein